MDSETFQVAAPDERVPVLEDLVARLTAAYPLIDAATVEATVAAYDSFRRARVRAYVPILVERRSRTALRAACRTPPGRQPDAVTVTHAGVAGESAPEVVATGP
ncbi:hypothetical protein AB0I68_12825 [Streptomyces sp. NPDC050448]|uniref:three-helix bundle dimerization domain-containing protein n=1 Tax=Streptomyces sp. NPDC050448 TaxID=3155404 RepID=UPI00342E8F22